MKIRKVLLFASLFALLDMLASIFLPSLTAFPAAARFGAQLDKQGAAATIVLIWLVIPFLVFLYARQLKLPAFPLVLLSILIPVVGPLLLAVEKPYRVEEVAAVSEQMHIGGKPAAEYQLGKPLAAYPLTPSHVVAVRLGLYLLAALGGFGLGYLVDAGAARVVSTQQYGLILPIGATASVLLAALVWQRGRRREVAPPVVVLEEGLTRTERGKTEVIRWDDVATVYQDLLDRSVNGIPTEKKRLYTIHLKNGSTHQFDQTLHGILELGATLHEQVAKRILPSLADAFNAGETLTFGEVWMNKSGIGANNDLLPWPSAGSVGIDSGFLVIAKKTGSSAELAVNKSIEATAAFLTRIVGTRQPLPAGPGLVRWKKVRVAKTPNVHAFVWFANQLLHAASG